MTCEVAVANRLGIALAADSAVTFTNGNSDKATYASGANKIFQLAGSEPVAVMVYSSADLNRMPWEVILKRYRKELGSGTFPALAGYASDLVAFINDRSERLLPFEVRAAGTRAAAADGVLYAFSQVCIARPVLSDPTADPAVLREQWQEALTEVRLTIYGEVVDVSLAADDLDGLQGEFAANLAGDLLQFLNERHVHLSGIVDCLDLVRLGLRCLFCRPSQVLHRYTGVVVAGYGVDEFLPGFIDLHVYGFVGSRVYWRTGTSVAVNNKDKESFIEPFARKSMVETFTQGASPEVWKAVRDAFVVHAARVVDVAAGRAGVQIPRVDIDAAIFGELDDFTQNWAVTVLRSHLAPLNNVIGSLNLEELAELAETMVMLESLKEKVTARTQGVGGPIDVAVITKSEGLVWIKRKHYFNADLNQRYLLRLQQGL